MEGKEVPYRARTIICEILANIEVLVNAERIDVAGKMSDRLGNEVRTHPKQQNCTNTLFIMVA